MKDRIEITFKLDEENKRKSYEEKNTLCKIIENNLKDSDIKIAVYCESDYSEKTKYIFKIISETHNKGIITLYLNRRDILDNKKMLPGLKETIKKHLNERYEKKGNWFYRYNNLF